MTADTGATHRLSARSLIIPATLTFAAVFWWAGRNGGVAHETSSVGEPAERMSEVATLERARASSEGHDLGAEASFSPGIDSEQVSDVGFRDYVSAKYRFLFQGAGLSPAEVAALTVALLERERIAVAINTARQSSDPSAREALSQRQAELETADQKVTRLLRPGDLAAFDGLKDSDIEQFQLEDYAGGVSQVAPVSEADKKAILYTKLAYRQRFRQVLADSRFMQDDLDAAERRRAFAEVRRALEVSRDSYLQEVRQYLYDEEQFDLLRNYETTEFNDELEKLRRMAYGG